MAGQAVSGVMLSQAVSGVRLKHNLRLLASAGALLFVFNGMRLLRNRFDQFAA